MKRYYCTYFDKQYLIKAIAMIESLRLHGDKFELFAVCMDELTRLVLQNLNFSNVTLIPIHEIEQRDEALLEAKKSRSLVEYYWTTTPTIILRLLERHPEINLITYLDADMYFYCSPEPIYAELGADSVLIHEHRFPPRLAYLEGNGKYNVGWLCFRNDAVGLEVLHWWRDRCIEWCYTRAENGKLGDQKYLDDWTNRFNGIHILQNIGAAVAPWNHEQYEFHYDENGKAMVDSQPLIFYHFHSLAFITPLIVLPFQFAGYPLVDTVLKICFVPYVNALLRATKTIQAIIPEFQFGLHNECSLSPQNSLLAFRPMRGEITRQMTQAAFIELDDEWDWVVFDKESSQAAASHCLSDQLQSNLDEYLQKANQAFLLDDLDEAENLFHQALDLAPDDPGLLVAHANILLRQNDIEAARLEFLKTTILAPNYVPAFINLAALQLFQKQYEQAESSLNHALELESDSKDGLKTYAQLMLAKKQYAKGIGIYINLLNHYPKDTDVLMALADCYLEAGQVESARTLFEEILKIDPENGVAIQKRDRQLTTGVETLDHFDPAETLQILLNSEDLPVALEQYKDRIDADLQALVRQNIDSARNEGYPELAEGLGGLESYIQGVLNSERGGIVEAQDDLISTQPANAVALHLKENEGVDESPEEIGKLLTTGNQFLQIGNIEEALSQFEKAAHFYPENPQAFALSGLILVFQKKFVEAEQVLRRALMLNPSDGNSKILLDGVLQEIEKTFGKEDLNVAQMVGYNPTSQKPAPKISVIVSTYKSEAFMRECLDDLESQTIVDSLEIIVLDAASPQREESIVREYQDRYNNILYIRTPQRIGVYAAWNLAIQNSHGEFITPFSTNDRLRKDAYEILCKTLLDSPEVALVYGDSFITVTPHETFENHTQVNVVTWPDYSYEDLLTNCRVGPHPMWRRSLHNELGYFDESYKAIGDQDFWLRIGANHSLLHLPVFTGLYWVTKGSLSGDPDIISPEIKRLRETYLPRYKNEKIL